jgi:hypothetical protein
VTSPVRARHHSWDSACGFSYMPPSSLHAHGWRCDHSSSRVPPSVVTRHCWYRNINLLSIDYAFRPRLRIRLTLGGFTVPRKPWVFGEQDSHLLYRYLFRHNRFQNVQASLPSPFTRLERSPTPARDQRSLTSRSFGCTLEPRSFSAQDLSISELLRTL